MNMSQHRGPRGRTWRKIGAPPSAPAGGFRAGTGRPATWKGTVFSGQTGRFSPSDRGPGCRPFIGCRRFRAMWDSGACWSSGPADGSSMTRGRPRRGCRLETTAHLSVARLVGPARSRAERLGRVRIVGFPPPMLNWARVWRWTAAFGMSCLAGLISCQVVETEDPPGEPARIGAMMANTRSAEVAGVLSRYLPARGIFH